MDSNPPPSQDAMPNQYNHELDRRLIELQRLRCGEQLTQQEIADYCGVSRVRIQQIEAKALKKLALLMPEDFRNYEAQRLGR